MRDQEEKKKVEGETCYGTWRSRARMGQDDVRKVGLKKGGVIGKKTGGRRGECENIRQVGEDDIS